MLIMGPKDFLFKTGDKRSAKRLCCELFFFEVDW
jgi:hypothetical protein